MGVPDGSPCNSERGNRAKGQRFEKKSIGSAGKQEAEGGLWETVRVAETPVGDVRERATRGCGS